MSVQLQVPGALDEATSLLLPTTAAADVLAMPAGSSGIRTIVGITVANDDTSACLVSVWWTNNATDYLIFKKSLAANTSEPNVIDVPLMFNAKETARKIRAQAATGNKVTVTVHSTYASQKA